MKKLFLFLLCFVSIVANATFVDLNLNGKNIPLEGATSHFEEWFGVPSSDFILYFEEVDDLGYRHQNYQQYNNGVLVENCALFVHSFDGVLTTINGDIMPTSLIPTTTENISVMKKTRKMADDQSGKEKGVVIIHIGDKFYKAYKVVVGLDEIYYDVETGAEIQRLSLGDFSNVNCTMSTLYSGTKTVPCNYSDGYYHLYDANRKVLVKYGDMGPYFNAEPSPAYELINSATTWTSYYLTSVTITLCHNSWWSSLGDANPDLYLTILNGDGNVVYTTDYKEDVTKYPVTFNFSVPIAIPANGGGYKIKIWDKDVLSDELGTTITLSSNTRGTHSWGSSTSNTEGTFEIKSGAPMYDAYWGTVTSHKFFQDIFGINSFDNKGSAVRVFLHAPTYGSINKESGYQSIFDQDRTDNYLNAAAVSDPDDTSFQPYIKCGMGNEYGNPLVGFNIIAHEFTHLVTAYRPNKKLVYQGESGAINEGYSDAFAEYAEYITYGSTDWLVDTDSKLLGYSFLRNIANPKNSGPEGAKPNTYNGQNWVSPTNLNNDNGGVHNNNSIFTYWFYLLSEGGQGTNDKGNAYRVEKIGIDKAAKIAWRMHRTFLPAQATFAQARQYAIQSAKELYPNDGDIVKAVTNAWYAVGVGDPYQEIMCVKAKIPSNWGKTILAYMWTSGEGSWYQIPREGDWCVVADYGPFNIIFVNGSTWNGDNNQTVDIAVTGDMCIQISNSTSGKRSYSVVNCPERTCVNVPYSEPFTSSIGAFTYVEYKKDYNLLKDIWQFDSQYGMVAKATYSSTKYASNAWLMSPCIEIPTSGTYVLSFEHAAKYFSSASTEMALWVSTDYEGLEHSCNWSQLTIPTYPTGSNWNFVNSGEISLAAFAGKNITLAFKYTSTSTTAPQWEIKNFKIEKKSGSAIDEVQASSSPSNKYIENGQLVIVRDGVRYNAQGQRLQ